MKKFVLPIILFAIVMPCMVDAKEYCKVVSGNGKDLGSEIACGTEHFYIIDSNKDEIKMLAKYNLNVGVSIYKEKIEKESGDTRSDAQYCQDLASSKNGVIKSDGFYSEPGYCFYAKRIETNKLLQNEEAISAHWDKDGNYLYPQVGDVYYSRDEISAFNYLLYPNSEYNSYFKIDKMIENTKFMNYNYDFDKFSIDLPIINYTSGSGFPYGIFNSLGHYKQELNDMNFNVNSISLLSISELNEIVNKISNRRLPLIDWSNNYDIISQQDNPAWHTTTNNEISFGSLKEIIPKDYSWLYSTSYWNRTIFLDGGSFLNTYFVFTSGLGKICGAGFPTCAPETAIGTGIRPVITIPNELQYLIKTETDGNGTINVIENSLGGETIQFKISANKGYKLGSIVIKTDSGEEVEFSEGEITKNDDGTFSINKNKFTMPFENVTIQAKFELENILKNPETGDKVLFIILILVVSIGIRTFIYKKKESRYNI